MINFGVEGEGLGVFLVLLNLIILFLAGWLAQLGYYEHKLRNTVKEQKVGVCMQFFRHHRATQRMYILLCSTNLLFSSLFAPPPPPPPPKNEQATSYEDARTFSHNKFNTTFDSIWKHSIPASHVLVFHYTSHELAPSARKSGIPAQVKFNGIPFSLRQPHVTKESDFEVFESSDETGSKVDHPTPTKQAREFPNEEVLVLSLPKHALEPLTGYEKDEGLCMISASVLNAMRPTSFAGVVDEKPWFNGFTLLPPHCILRSFLIMDKATEIKKASANKSELTHKIATKDATNHDVGSNAALVEDVTTQSSKVKMILVKSISTYIETMNKIRQKASEHELIPLFHYTSANVASMILSGGLRMSTQGQGDGGVYVSTLGPASYGLGSSDYEVNIIKDCFGVERLSEYVGKGKLDVVLIYGCEGAVLQQVKRGVYFLWFLSVEYI
jgi:hypothetical protein